MRRLLPQAMILLCLVALTACVPSDARAVWKEGIKRCAQNDLLGPNVFYFGPSNSLGPGTVFQPFASGGTQESFLLESYIKPPDRVISPNPAVFTCSAQRAVKSNIGAELPLDAALPVGASVGAHLKRARTVKVWADELQWVSLLTGEYRQAVIGLPDSNAVKQAISKEGHLVLARALRVKGMKAELEFATDVGADVKAKVPDISGDKEVKLNGSWDGNTKLTLTATSDFFIAGELRRWSETGLAAGEIGELAPNTAGWVYRRK